MQSPEPAIDGLRAGLGDEGISAIFVDLEWGEPALRFKAHVHVIVDVLSFSTTTTVAVGRGYEIFPFAFGSVAKAFGEAIGVPVADKRSQAKGCLSLSPASFQSAEQPGPLVLPSPNGSRLSLFSGAATVLVGCLRNATAVAQTLSDMNRDTMIVAAGEHWPDGTIRFAIEDYLGAGAILAALASNSHGADLSAEALVCAKAFGAARDDLFHSVSGSRSGRELREQGFPQDVQLACEVDSAETVPTLRRCSRAYEDVLSGADLEGLSGGDAKIGYFTG